MFPGLIGSCNIWSLKASKTASETNKLGVNVTPIKPRGVWSVTAPTVHDRLSAVSFPVLGEAHPGILDTAIVSPGCRLNRSKSYSLPF
jgi:hypothetical protein